MDYSSQNQNQQHEQQISNPPADVQGWKPAVRRPRVTLSCRICKMRKVRCDRRTPVCMRCANSGWHDQCTYDNDVEKSTPQARQSAPALPVAFPDSRQQSLQDKITGNPTPPQTVSTSSSEHVNVSPLFMGANTNQQFNPLEQMQRHDFRIPAMDQISVFSNPIDPFPPIVQSSTDDTNMHHATDFYLPTMDGSAATTPLSPSPPPGVVIAMQGAGFETTFSGPTSSISCIASFPHFAETLNTINNDYVSTRNLATVTPPELSKPSLPDHPSPLSLDGLVALFPPQFRCQQLMQVYFKHYNCMFRILHPPVFWQRYNDFWNRPRDITDPMPYIIMAAISCARCLEQDNPPAYIADSSVANREAIQWANIAKQWSDRQGLKHPTLEFFQLKCLVLLSQKLNLIKQRSHYPSSQTLLAIALRAGLHRSVACLSRRTSFYEREMRCRIWWAITELELSECIERGLPSLVQNLDADSEPLSNIADADLDEGTIFPPTHYQDSTFTESSFARHGKLIQSLRHRVNTLANNATKHRSMPSSEINILHEEIVSRLSDVLTAGAFQSNKNDGKVVFCRTVLELYLHELLLLLHLPFALATSEQFSHYHSRFVCQGSTRSTIKLFAGLDEIGISQMSLSRAYLQRALFVLCLMDMLAPPQNPIYSPTVDSNEAVTLALKTFDMYEERILTRGDGFRGFWLIFVASCYLRQHREGNAATLWKEKISARIIALCSKISMLQPASSQSEQFRDAVFARYMKHLQRTGVFAGFEIIDS